MFYRSGCAGMLLALVAMGATAQGTSSKWGVPMPANGARPTLTLLSEQSEPNLLSIGISAGTVLDDNAFSSDEDNVSDLFYQLRPSIRVQQSRPRVGWSFGYTPGISVHQRLPDRGVLTHGLIFNVEGQPWRHVTIRFRENFRITTNPFESVDEGSLPEFGEPNRPNESIQTPTGNRISNLASLDLSYQFSARSMIGIGGDYSEVRRRNLAGAEGSRLLDKRRVLGRAFYAYRATRHQSIGLMYNFRKISNRKSSSRVLAHTLLYFHSFQLSPNSTFSLFAGPEYTEVRDQIVLDLDLFPAVSQLTFSAKSESVTGAGGLTYGWQANRTSFRLGLLRQVGGGGSLRGSSRVHRVQVGVRRQVARQWILNLSASYNDSETLNLSTSSDSIRTARGRVGLTQRLGEHFRLRYQYSYVQQGRRGDLLGLRDEQRNRYSVSFAYQFTRPLGR